MKLVSLTCPECRANVDVDVSGERKVSFCQYCGAKILLDNEEQVIHTKHTYENVAEVKKIEAQQESEKRQYEQEEKDVSMPFHKWLRKMIQQHPGGSGLAVMVILYIVIMIAIFAVPAIGDAIEEHKYLKEKERLEQIVSEIEVDISNHNYDSALYKANSLVVSGERGANEWDNRRKSIITQINQLQARDNGKLAAPGTSEMLKGQNISDVKKSFESAGFTNVKTEEIKDLIKGWLIKDGAVEYVKIAGISSYTENDWYDPDVEVIIYYHTYM
ncbi:MAG: hypothetical protein J6F31_07900 [Oscillospiraceae bacterium]|nr:hypothetical protein [Oscillospiraceae bacterium]